MKIRRGRSAPYEIGRRSGVRANIAPHSTSYAACAGATDCRMISRTWTQVTSALVDWHGCNAAVHGRAAINPAQHVIAIFNTPRPGPPADDRCQLRLVVARNPADGCLPAGTKIRMADGTQRPIEAIAVGDRVWNAMYRTGVRVAATTAGTEQPALLELTTPGGKIRVTRDHPMITRRGLIAARELHVGDFIRSDSGIFRVVQSITSDKNSGPTEVWNLILENLEFPARRELRDLWSVKHASLDPDLVAGQTFVADGFVVGDMTLQRMLKGEDVAAVDTVLEEGTAKD